MKGEKLLKEINEIYGHLDYKIIDTEGSLAYVEGSGGIELYDEDIDDSIELEMKIEFVIEADKEDGKIYYEVVDVSEMTISGVIGNPKFKGFNFKKGQKFDESLFKKLQKHIAGNYRRFSEFKDRLIDFHEDAIIEYLEDHYEKSKYDI